MHQFHKLSNDDDGLVNQSGLRWIGFLDRQSGFNSLTGGCLFLGHVMVKME